VNSAADWNITPAEYLRRIGVEHRNRGKWLSVKLCPFCKGGDHGDKFTFAVHATEGNFSCLRASCGASGNFWKLIELTGGDPRDHRGERKPQQIPKKKKKHFVYGR
jgi:hypothetical protein